MEVSAQYDALLSVTEGEHFVNYLGDLYCLSETCEGCSRRDTCEYEEGEIETGYHEPEVAVRRAVGFGKIYDSNPYKHQISANEVDNYNYINGRFTSILPDEGYLPDQNVKGIYKQLPELPTEEPTDFMVYREEDSAYYCIRQVCSLCEFHKNCKPTILIRPKEMSVISNDLKAQEPRLFTLTSKEPNWIKVLQNDSLNENPKLLVYINALFQSHPELMVDIERDKNYWEYLDDRFFFDKTNIYLYNAAVLKHKRLNSGKSRANLEEFIEHFVQDYKEFIKDRKADRAKKGNKTQ